MMKTKQPKDECDKSAEDETAEPKTRARKKATDTTEDDKAKNDEPKTSRVVKKTGRPKALAKKQPLGIRKILRNKKNPIIKDKLKNVLKQGAKRGRKPAVPKTEPNQDKDDIPLIPAAEIKKEPVDDASPTSRSSSPKTAGRRQRLSSDILMMKSMLADTPTTALAVGPRTSPYSTRKERSNSPSVELSKNLRSGKPRLAKSNLLSEVVLKEQKKRSRLLSDSKTNIQDAEITNEDCKKIKRGRSCSRDGSEISKCSDVTESDISIPEPLYDTDLKETNKKIEKIKTDVDVNIESSVQMSTNEKVPSLTFEPKSPNKFNAESSSFNEKSNRKMSLTRSTSLDSDNNNSNRLKLQTIQSTLDIEDQANLLLKTDNDMIFKARSSILTSMSKTFNSKHISKNIRKARRGRKGPAVVKSPTGLAKSSNLAGDAIEEKNETLESLSKEIDDLITNLDHTIDLENNITGDNITAPVDTSSDSITTKTVSKFYSLSKPLCDNNSIVSSPDTSIKDKEAEGNPSKNNDCENIRLHYEEEPMEKPVENKSEMSYKNNLVNIGKLMDRLKEFEELDKRRQRQESDSKCESKPVMVSNDVVLIPKSGADIKPLKDIQSVRSPEKPIEKENVLSCFENNSAISIVKRDQVRKSVEMDRPNSVTLIKRNSISRKESTGSNHSRESNETISLFEKTLGKDVTLTEIRKSVDKSMPATPVDLHQFAMLYPNNPNQSHPAMVLDTKQISIMALSSESKPEYRRKSSESVSRKSSETIVDHETDKAVLEMVTLPTMKPLPIITPVTVKSVEPMQIDTDPIAPILDALKDVPVDESMATIVPVLDEKKMDIACLDTINKIDMTVVPNQDLKTSLVPIETTIIPTNNIVALQPKEMIIIEPVKNESCLPIKTEDSPSTIEPEINTIIPPTNESAVVSEVMSDNVTELPKAERVEMLEISKLEEDENKEYVIKSEPGPSNAFPESPETQKRKENILRTLGLLTHKAAKEVKIERIKEKERIMNQVQSKSKPSKSNMGDYTGTLKTVIKLNRGTGERDRKRYTSSLKMTFQKSKNRTGKPAAEQGEAAPDVDAYYTIERREGGIVTGADGVHRKSYSNRLNHDQETVAEAVEPKENLVIPEKSSSFSIHPGRLCMDQCFYCGGKFGLFDTPCHIAQMKSSERQKKVLENEEKLTIDSCLCDACYRHVDRRANCPSYRKRPLVKQIGIQPSNLDMTQQTQQSEKPLSPPLEDDSEEETADATAAAGGGRPAICHTEGCTNLGEHSIRRKWLIKMRGSVNKVLQLKGDYPGLHTIPLCADHHRLLAPLMACKLCRRRITKHHNVHFIHHGFLELNVLLKEASIPVEFSERPILCKMCRYYCSLLQRPKHNDDHAKSYRRRLLKLYNVEDPVEQDNNDQEEINFEEENAQKKKKNKTKTKQRRSTEHDKSDLNETIDGQNTTSMTNERTNDNIEEDIESLISSNKILVPGAPKTTETPAGDNETGENNTEGGQAVLIDKQTELQYLLQMQNNPAQFLKLPVSVAQKEKNSVKSSSAIHKPGHQHRINDKNAKRQQKLGQMIMQKEKEWRETEIDQEKPAENAQTHKNININDECTIESVPNSNKKLADINILKNKWQMSDSFTQVKKNLSELSRKLPVDKVAKKLTELKYSNPVRRLETNPSISVRELFPGEEEMNLQCSVEFNNVKGVTPEGWEKCATTIQYDPATKKLWNELQRPYGNQSSFLRHLVILEKYFRSGDLVLSQNASQCASNYSESVQSRLRAYDNMPSETPRRTESAVSLIEFRKQKNTAGTSGKSLLKVNQNMEPSMESKKTCMPPPGTLPKAKSKAEGKKPKQLPPELIAINTPGPNTQGRKILENALHNIQQLVKDVSAPFPVEVASAPLPPTTITMTMPVAPKLDTPKKHKLSSKPWRPTLMPITQENLSKIEREPLQQAVDGRKLPSLVQVMSSGKRYHITLQDYNKMCVMRREKLQQLREDDSSKKDDSFITEIQPSALLGNGGTLKQNIEKSDTDKSKVTDQMAQIGNAATMLKNVGLKNITIAPIPTGTATTSTMKIPHLSTSVSITSESVITPAMITPSTMPIVMPKIPKSLTVIPQTIVSNVPPPMNAILLAPPPPEAIAP